MPRPRLHKCPKCHATETEPLGDSGDRKCSYCGAHFSIERAAVPGSERSPEAARKQLLIASALLGIIALSGIVIRVTTNRSSKAPAQRRSGATRSLATPSSVASGTSTTLDAEDQKEREPLTASFKLHDVQLTSLDSRWFYGMVTNTSKVALSKPEIIIVLEDEAGKEIATASGYAKHALAPGENSPVRIIHDQVVDYATLKFELNLSELTSQVAEGLVVSEHNEQRNKHGKVDISGKIKNDGTHAARFVEVLALCFDEDDKLINMSSAYAKSDSVAPGDEARFVLSVYDGKADKKIERIEFRVTGSVDTR